MNKRSLIHAALALAFAAASSRTDQRLIGELVAAHGRAGFAAAWLKARGLAWAAALLPAQMPTPRPAQTDSGDLFSFAPEEKNA